MEDEFLRLKCIDVQEDWLVLAKATSEITIPYELMKSTVINEKETEIEKLETIDDFIELEFPYKKLDVAFFQEIYSKIEFPEKLDDYLLVTYCPFQGTSMQLYHNLERSSILDPFLGLRYNFMVDDGQIRISLLYSFITELEFCKST